MISFIAEQVLLDIPRYLESRAERWKSYRHYLHYALREDVLDGLRRLDKRGRSRRDRTTIVNRARDKITVSRDHRATDAEVAEELGIDESEVMSADQYFEFDENWQESLTCPFVGVPMSMEAFNHLTHPLTPKHKEILRLYYVEKWTQPQIANKLDCSQSAISKHIRASRKFLKEMLLKNGASCR